jgi:hypothetical protein
MGTQRGTEGSKSLPLIIRECEIESSPKDAPAMKIEGSKKEKAVPQLKTYA